MTMCLRLDLWFLGLEIITGQVGGERKEVAVYLECFRKEKVAGLGSK